MKAIFICLFLLFLPLTAQLQTREIDLERNVVISTNGINLREFPNRGSKVLTAIPFGERVVILNEKSFGTETIGHYVDFDYGYAISGYERENKIAIKGDWIKVSYKGQRGFVFSGYLGYKSDSNNKNNTDFNREVVLLYQTTSCYTNIYPPQSYNWYGVYHKKNIYEIRPITISYYYDDYTEPGLTPFVTSTSDNRDLAFIIGSKTKMKEGRIDGTNFPGQERYFRDETRTNHKLLNELSMERVESSGGQYLPYLKLKSGNKRQILNIDDDSPLQSIVWMGDLDQDGKRDYIIYYGDEESMMVLYLSSHAKAGQIVKPVAVYYSGYCC